ncbi:MAG: phosphate ABC transporter permease subunit PstC [Actinomycetota bacterium]
MSISPGLQATPEARELSVIFNRADRIFRRIVTAGALTSLILLGLIGTFLFVRSAQIFNDRGLKFITGSNWTAGSGDGVIPDDFSIGPMLTGTLLVSLIALVLSMPLAIGGALFVEFYATPGLKKVLTTLLDLAAAIPSLIFGLWGVVFFSSYGERWSDLLNSRFGWLPLMEVQNEVFGRSPFVAGCVLASLITPIITSVSREVFSRTPRDLVDTCYALGSTRWGAIKTVVLPFGKSGVIGGAMLGLGRALGETVAVYLLLNIVFRYNFRILESEGGNIASLIALKFGEATEYELKALVAAGFVLFLLTLVVNIVAASIVERSTRHR